ncbi:prostaglandin E synthase 3 isoform X2 [Bacillus rossius redtenbacheri]|uniref:prostaglandin E synthase 3 isoform X2 n=1 Tax=Bacillus rossius redtenbacheri TaxID=93214 RepID=UPI002FDDE853
MSDDQVTPPPVMWAQRSQIVFLTICLEDCKNPEIKIEPDKIYFHGIGGTEKKEHEVTMNLYKDVDPEKSLKFVRDRNIELVLKKKDDGPYWPQLMKDKKKYHWLKVDFNKWKDEDDSEDDMGQSEDLEEMMRQMGGLGGAGDSKPSFDDVEPESDSDDEDIPDLE